MVVCVQPLLASLMIYVGIAYRMGIFLSMVVLLSGK